MHTHALIALSGILLVGILCQWIAWRVKLPAILFLLLSGILVGPVVRFLNPDVLFGDMLFPFISLAVAVILFEGSLTLKFQDIPGLQKVIRNMITVGAMITLLITAVATRLLLDFSWEVSFLFGALMVVTGPTVIMPMLRTVRPKENLAHILRWEGILIDPIGATLAVLVFQFIVAGGVQDGITDMLLVFSRILAIGGILGCVSGYLFGLVMRRHWIPHYLANFAALALVCTIFALSDSLEPESGLLSVTVMGIWLANTKGVELDQILDFKEHLSVVLISMLFIILAARMDLSVFTTLGWPALALFGVIQFLSRPITAQVSAYGSKLSMAERHFLAWIAPRGIIAAAISAVFAIKLESLGYFEAPKLVPLTFMVIVGTVLLQSATARPIAKLLKVAEPEPKGFLIVGADKVARAVAEELKENGFPVQLTDQNWENVMAARMAGLRVYWGNPVSEHAERHLSLIGIGRLLALSQSRELNALAAQYYRMEFGSANVFSIRTRRPEDPENGAKSSIRASGRQLFGEDVTYDTLADLIEKGAELKTTPLTDKFTFELYMDQCEEKRIPLFAVTPGGRIHLFTAEREFTPKAEWRIIGIAACMPLPDEGRRLKTGKPPAPSGAER
ncbi:cation:proton antiporter [Salidesulfovibrio brasiliensis]|uniref:cation:proton antiporter n=1 Tax=Salidesulfovibrio brasiliensis TaxID=221711 RepID=UPI0006CF3A0F|nr:sodium:proton antiporter [Salidesulfovibrio brasiliensis]